LKKLNREKKSIKILKNLIGSVLFYKFETEKIKLNRKNRAELEKNLSQTEKIMPNRFEPGFFLKKLNLTKTDRFEPVSILLKKIQFKFFFFNKNQTEPKITISISLSRCFL
jgi:hypothetical protein